jgi:hypothetical protein
LSREILLVCEGATDAHFFKHLLARRKVAGFDIDWTLTEDAGGRVTEGKDAFEAYLRALRTEFEKVERFTQAVILVADNDDQPQAQFRNVQKQIAKAGSFGVPDAPLELRQSAVGLPPLAILMLPWNDEPGSLETLLLQAVFSEDHKGRQCVEDFSRATGV